MIIIKRNTRILFNYIVSILLIFFPLLKFGYIETFDMAWGPRILIPLKSNDGWFFYHLLTIFSFFLSSMIVQKLLLLGLFILMGIGAHRLVLFHSSLKKHPELAYLAGIFYIFNPYVYTRLMAGQWLVLCGYALLPWTLMSIWRLMQLPNRKNMVLAAAWSIAVGLTSIHTVGFVIVAALVMFCLAGKEGMKKRTLWCGGALVLWLVVNCFWFIPLLIGHSHTASQISSFGPSQLQAFATRGTIAHSVPLTSLLLEGFWADPQGRYYLPSHLGAYWWIVVILLASIIISGIYRIIRNRDRLGIALIILAAIAWWLGMGVGGSLSAGTSNWLVVHIPFYRGYREPQKWLMLLALAYSYFLALGASWLLDKIKSVEWRQASLGLIALLPIAYTPLLLWGAGGQLISAEYPSDWKLAAQKLNQDKSNYKVLVLPWHEYLPLSFAKRVVANPAGHYFKQDVIVSDNPELKGVPPSESTPLYKLLDNDVIPSRGEQTNDAKLLKPYGVKYVLVLKEADWRSYNWVNKQTGWQRIQDTKTIELYKMRAS